MGAADRVNCAFMYVSFLLSAIYLGLLLFVLRYLTRLFKREDKRKAQKFFLALVVLQCVGRCTYFLAWPITGETCDPTLTSDSFTALGTYRTPPHLLHPCTIHHPTPTLSLPLALCSRCMLCGGDQMWLALYRPISSFRHFQCLFSRCMLLATLRTVTVLFAGLTVVWWWWCGVVCFQCAYLPLHITT